MDAFGWYLIVVAILAAALAATAAYQMHLYWLSNAFTTMNGCIQRNQFISAMCALVSVIALLMESLYGRNIGLHNLQEILFDISSFFLLHSLLTALVNTINMARLAIHASVDENETEQIRLMFLVCTVMLLAAELSTATLRAYYDTYVFSMILICCYVLIMVVATVVFWIYIRRMFLFLEATDFLVFKMSIFSFHLVSSGDEEKCGQFLRN